MKKYSTLIWDFNGTLVDDVHAALAAVNDMLTKRNQPTIDLDRYQQEVDTPIINFYNNVFLPGTLDFSDAVVEFNIGYDKYLPEKPLMEGAQEMLRFFSSRGKRQTVVSASNVQKVTRMLTSLGIINYFERVIARDDYMAGDKLYLAKQYFQEESIDPSDALVIGDCVADWQMAKALGADSVLITRGHQGRREFSVTDALIIDNLSELKSIIE
ncbi:MAG: HAD family hydrolase [Ruminococcus sp.]|nr:HAD family hydrolase [Ruminococcus sp.]